MSEIQIVPGIKFSGDDRPETLDIIGMREAGRVYLWDIGPEKPVVPKRPVPPKGNENDPQYALDKVEFAEMLDEYQAALKKAKSDREEHAKWHRRNDGPIECLFDAPSATEALENDARAVAEGRQIKRRWYLSSRTRGSSGLANRGLPENTRPGKGQAELERRAAEGESDLIAARRADPVFGKQELRGS